MAIGRWSVIAIAIGMTCIPGLMAGGDALGEAAPTRIALLGFDLINSSLQPTSPEEMARLRQLDEQLREQLSASGRYAVVDIPTDLQQQIDAEADIRNCNGCERNYARQAGASLAAWGTVQKVSNLILNINLYMENVETGELTFVKSVDIRGNTDESWQHGLSYMLRHYLLKPD
ncbi:DUF3280 domain-containing protein [Dongia soli]|uniref:DUF3280 domain-containing protein n=1 Tax=Dongia soli TaxID=600628 RepID=A0ABU5EC77_9PROT|nr:DUF3280 domain-containing protein [Dongia soli]MDY0883477.1 DUF3280 domain-containing protein [Dongia soli]